jgi:hypothetical protein
LSIPYTLRYSYLVRHPDRAAFQAKGGISRDRSGQRTALAFGWRSASALRLSLTPQEGFST